MNKLQRIWQRFAPNFLLNYIRFLLEPESYKSRRKAVLAHFKKMNTTELPPEVREGLRYLKTHKYSPFPYYWTQKYDNLLPEVFLDSQNSHHYVLFEGKRMYFPGHYSKTHIIWSLRSILKEQDPVSSHLYLTNSFQVEKGSIVIDAGVAEGNFALSVVEKVQKIYLVECDTRWVEALRLTFSPWKDKVVFVEKYMSDEESADTTSIDALLQPIEDSSYFIKLDIEGFEQKALAGMTNLIHSGASVKMDVCTYHRPNDFIEIKSKLLSMDFECEVSNGYVLYFLPGEEPSFRRNLIRATKR